MKYTTAKQLARAVYDHGRLKVAIGSGELADASDRTMQEALTQGYFSRATFWGFDSEGNNIVEIKSPNA